VLKEQSIYILVLDDSSNDAETVANMLRNAGHAVNAKRIEDDEDLREALGKENVDLVLSKPDIPGLSADEVLNIIDTSGKHIPLLLIGDDADETRLQEMLNAGARDVVLISQPKRLEHALLREMISSREHRKLLQFETKLDEANRRAQTLVDSSRDAITYVHDGMHIYANQSYLEMFGFSSMDDVEGMPILNMVKKEEHSRFKKFLRDFDNVKADSDTIDVDGLRPDGSSFNITMEFALASYDGEPCTQIIIRKQANNEELEKKLKDMSKLDLVTGAYNRVHFFDSFNAVVGKPGQEGMVFYLKPDNFKKLREEIGIDQSDRLLADLVQVIIHKLTGKNDILARFDSEYFLLLLPGQSQEHAEQFAEALCKAISEHLFNVNGKSISLTCSIGIYQYDESSKHAQDVLNRAEKGLHESEEQGGNCYTYYIPGEDELAEQERFALLSKQIKHALKNNLMQLMFQPIVSLKGDENKNYEVLLRMRDEKKNILPPKSFLPAADHAGLMTAIDRWVLAHSIKVISEQRRAGNPVRLFVKLSASSLKDNKFLAWLQDILKAAHAEPDTLVIEVFEDVVGENANSYKILAQGLKTLHVKLAIDHFGTAENSVTLAKKVTADYLKLDSSIVGALSSSSDAQNTVHAISAALKDKPTKLIANAVEDPHTLATIYSTGVDYIQGFFLQEPTASLDYDFSSMG
jgi:multidomain signaling protein FimX